MICSRVNVLPSSSCIRVKTPDISMERNILVVDLTHGNDGNRFLRNVDNHWKTRHYIPEDRNYNAMETAGCNLWQPYDAMFLSKNAPYNLIRTTQFVKTSHQNVSVKQFLIPFNATYTYFVTYIDAKRVGRFAVHTERYSTLMHVLNHSCTNFSKS
jgi:hypothetical protein